jgi:hypothetical protein
MLCIHCGTLSESAKLSIIILAGVVVYLKQIHAAQQQQQQQGPEAFLT